jgi:hypothetical protein
MNITPKPLIDFKEFASDVRRSAAVSMPLREVEWGSEVLSMSS